MQKEENPGPVLVDTDVLVASTLEFDLGHEKALQIFQQLEAGGRELIVLNLVIHEAATVISHRAGQQAAIELLNRVKEEYVVFLDKKLERLAWEEFRNQTKKGTSFTDCANLALCRKLGVDEIFSFDLFYKRNGIARFGIDA